MSMGMPAASAASIVPEPPWKATTSAPGAASTSGCRRARRHRRWTAPRVAGSVPRATTTWAPAPTAPSMRARRADLVVVDRAERDGDARPAIGGRECGRPPWHRRRALSVVGDRPKLGGHRRGVAPRDRAATAGGSSRNVASRISAGPAVDRTRPYARRSCVGAPRPRRRGCAVASRGLDRRRAGCRLRSAAIHAPNSMSSRTIDVRPPAADQLGDAIGHARRRSGPQKTPRQAISTRSPAGRRHDRAVRAISRIVAGPMSSRRKPAAR